MAKEEDIDLFDLKANSIALPPNLYQDIKESAFSCGIPVSILVGAIIHQWLKSNKDSIIQMEFSLENNE